MAPLFQPAISRPTHGRVPMSRVSLWAPDTDLFWVDKRGEFDSGNFWQVLFRGILGSAVNWPENFSMQRLMGKICSRTRFFMRRLSQRNKIFLVIGILAVAGAALQFILGRNIALPFVCVGVASFMFMVLWDMPPKHKNFSDGDRVQATSLVLAGFGSPELPLPEDRMRRKKSP